MIKVSTISAHRAARGLIPLPSFYSRPWSLCFHLVPRKTFWNDISVGGSLNPHCLPPQSVLRLSLVLSLDPLQRSQSLFSGEHYNQYALV